MPEPSKHEKFYFQTKIFAVILYFFLNVYCDGFSKGVNLDFVDFSKRFLTFRTRCKLCLDLTLLLLFICTLKSVHLWLHELGIANNISFKYWLQEIREIADAASLLVNHLRVDLQIKVATLVIKGNY